MLYGRRERSHSFAMRAGRSPITRYSSPRSIKIRNRLNCDRLIIDRTCHGLAALNKRKTESMQRTNRPRNPGITTLKVVRPCSWRRLIVHQLSCVQCSRGFTRLLDGSNSAVHQAVLASNSSDCLNRGFAHKVRLIDPLPPSAALPLTRGRMRSLILLGLVSPS